MTDWSLMPPLDAREEGPALKPIVARLLDACGLALSFERGEGDHLFYADETGALVPVLDLLGGYGASLFGHNHPELVAAAQEVLSARRPFNAQGSIRARAERLAARLSSLIGRTTGARYIATFASTGAEAVEAAVKHAALELTLRRKRDQQELDDNLREARTCIRDGSVDVAPSFLDEAARALGVPSVARIEQLFALVRERAEAVLSAQPRFLALEGAFHGKTTGAVQLTHNAEFREHWPDVGLSAVTFIPPEDGAALAAAQIASRSSLVGLHCGADGALVLTTKTVSSLAGCFVEPIQGEGGIRVISADYLRMLRGAADTDGFALIFDEIQCGMGRSGTFLASEPSGVAADYYLLSKSLGGGLAKISALLVDARRYVDSFGLLHTSTFADDDFSSTIALRALDLLERDGGALMQHCRRAGDRLADGLHTLAARFPGQLAEVRGRGLMIGVELASQADSASPLLRVLGEQNLLTYLVAGYLVRVHRIRVAPTLSSHSTIRIEPSALVEDADIDRFLGAFGETLSILRAADAAALVAPLMGDGERPAAAAQPSVPAVVPPSPATWSDRRKVGFLVHFMVPEDLAAWEPRLRVFTETGQRTFLNRMRGLLAPFVFDRAELRSSTGAMVDLVIIAVPFTAQQALDSLRSGSSWATDFVKAAFDLARTEACGVLGLGGYTSIVTDNGRDLTDDEIVLTSGNSLTAAAALEALWLSAARLRIDTSRARLGILGAAGNIGAALAELAAERVKELVLVGRQGAARLLEPVVDAIYAAEFRRLAAGVASDGIAAAIARTATVERLLTDPSGEWSEIGQIIRLGLKEELGAAAPIQLSHDVGSLRSCQLILSATNAPRPVVRPAHVPDGPVVVCDVAVPRDVDHSVVAERPEAVVLRGGIVRAPLGQQFHFAGARLQEGELYACLAEAALLGFVGCDRHYSRGPLTASRIREIRALAAEHGFVIEERLARETIDEPA
jgi:acetylornithine/succinyldiaminopimelate/putrescine aminotransferase/predicted amino acid dehydrogenase